jgi:hypothetical protein
MIPAPGLLQRSGVKAVSLAALNPPGSPRPSAAKLRIRSSGRQIGRRVTNLAPALEFWCARLSASEHSKMVACKFVR